MTDSPVFNPAQIDDYMTMAGRDNQSPSEYYIDFITLKKFPFSDEAEREAAHKAQLAYTRSIIARCFRFVSGITRARDKSNDVLPH